jgi:hypothetical protein
MKVSILQPAYLPWLGFFDQMAHSDLFVFLDDVQFTKRDWRNRNRLRTQSGWTWMTVPVQQKNRYRQPLRETRIDNTARWRRKHLETLRHNYARAPFFHRYFPYFDALYNKEWIFLIDLCFDTIDYLQEALHIATPVCLSSEMKIRACRQEKILAICAQTGATKFLAGDRAVNYLEPEAFRSHSIALEYQHYQHPVYAQQYPGAVPYLSVVDLLFNHGDQSLDILLAHSGASAVPAV